MRYRKWCVYTKMAFKCRNNKYSPYIAHKVLVAVMLYDVIISIFQGVCNV